jgi:hypothetical protein
MRSISATPAITVPCPRCGASPDVQCGDQLHQDRKNAAAHVTREANRAARRTMADIEAAERRVRAAYLDQHGCEPGAIYTREKAVDLLAQGNSK